MHDIVDLRSDALTLRCVTHKNVDGQDIERAPEAFREITSAW